MEDSKLFVRGRVSIGDDPVGKLVCEQVVPFSEVPRELWIQFADMDQYYQEEKKLMEILGTSEGKDHVVIYLGKERAKKVLPPQWNVSISGDLTRRLSGVFGEPNVKTVEKALVFPGKMKAAR